MYDGDVLPFNGESGLWLQLRRSRISLVESNNEPPRVVLHALPKGFAVDLQNGTVDIATAENERFEAIADGVRIEPLRDAAASLGIIRVDNTRLQLVSVTGALRLSMGAQVERIEAGHSYRVDLVPDGLVGGSDNDRGARYPGKNRFTVTMIVAIGIGTGVAVWLALLSPCRP